MSDQDDGKHETQATPRGSLGSGVLSSSGSSISPSTSSGGSNSAKSSVSDCLGAWFNYLQVMNQLCATGYRLAQAITNMDQQAGNPAPNPGTQLAWDDLTKATLVATNTVKSHVISILQDYCTQQIINVDNDEVAKIKDHNQGIVTEITQTMINLQHQFCLASYDSFSHLMCCFMCQAPVGTPHELHCTILQQTAGLKLPQIPPEAQNISGFCPIRPFIAPHSDHNIGHEQPTGSSPHQDIRGPSPIQGFLENIRGPLPNPGQLQGMKAPFYRGSRSPLNFPLFPLSGQRRWSEAAAGEVSGAESVSDAESQRRWSMPWEATKTDRNTVSWHQTRIMPMSKLAIPERQMNDRSQSTTPDSTWQQSSQDGLFEAIQLLSFKPNVRFQHTSNQMHIGPPFIEEQSSEQNQFEMWNQGQKQPPFIQFGPQERPSSDDNPT